MALSDIVKISFEYVPKAGHRQLPELSKEYESNVPGLFIVGDLADAPVIKIALNQGFDIATRVAKKPDAKANKDGVLDVIIIGAGPAGIGAAIACINNKLSYVVIEKEKPLNTIQNYPKNKHVFAEPKPIANKPMIWLDDTLKEDLLQRWEKLIDDKGIEINQPEEVTDIKKSADGFFTVTTAKGTYLGKRVILAIGRRGSVKRLGLPGEDRVDYALGDPDKYKGRKVIVVGGGDSAVEAAVALSKVEGTEVGIVHRQDGFFRVKEGNRLQAEEQIKNGKIRFYAKSQISKINPDSVEIKGPETQTVPNDDLFVMFGGEPPIPFLRKIGVKMEGTWDWKRAVWLLATCFIVYFVYGVKKPIYPFDAGTTNKALSTIGILNTVCTIFPWGLPDGFDKQKNRISNSGACEATFKDEEKTQLKTTGWNLQEFFTVHEVWGLSSVVDKEATAAANPGVTDPKESKKVYTVQSITRDLGPAFWYTVLYTSLMYVFGFLALKRWKSSRHQRLRFTSLLAFQTLFAFIIPEFFAPYIFNLVDGGIESWKFYAVANPWPLAGTWAYRPDYDPDGIKTFLVITIIISFILLPIFVIFNGKRFCTWLCGCGGLAETLGDRWRHLAPKSQESRNAEWQGTVILGLAFVTAAVILYDFWDFMFGSGKSPDPSSGVHQAAMFASNYYSFIIDFWLVAVIPVALYPFFGGKIWCRFWCPMAKYLQLMSKWFSKLQIKSNDKCIGCGECTRYCQVGIDVQSFAQRKQAFSNASTSCIQCGICIDVCPMEVLSFDSNRRLAYKK
jgi:NosR/NirI family transcriptional regulator, nitrous oxide reductase regulator